MKRIGIRELRAKASAVLSDINLTGETVEITRHWRPVARLVPICQTPGRSVTTNFRSVWADMDDLAAEISALWPEEISAAEAASQDLR